MKSGFVVCVINMLLVCLCVLSQMMVHTACAFMAVDRPNACMVLHDMSTAAYVLIKATRSMHEAAEL